VLGRCGIGAVVTPIAGLRMLQQARDEAHRFAVTYNRKRRSIRTVTSELLSVPGIGPSKRRLLLQTFGSIQGVRDASIEQIAALPGFSAISARRLLESLAPRGEQQPPNDGDPAVPPSDVEYSAPNVETDVPSTASAVPDPSPTFPHP
jgi:excinuclease ABC subunit C